MINTRTIAFTIATRFRETVRLGFTLCSLARVSRRDRCHLGVPPKLQATANSIIISTKLRERGQLQVSLYSFSQRIINALATGTIIIRSGFNFEGLVYRRTLRELFACATRSTEMHGLRQFPHFTNNDKRSATASDLARATAGC